MPRSNRSATPILYIHGSVRLAQEPLPVGSEKTYLGCISGRVRRTTSGFWHVSHTPPDRRRRRRRRLPPPASRCQTISMDDKAPVQSAPSRCQVTVFPPSGVAPP